jgi:hypothetical protein
MSSCKKILILTDLEGSNATSMWVCVKSLEGLQSSPKQLYTYNHIYGTEQYPTTIPLGSKIVERLSSQRASRTELTCPLSQARRTARLSGRESNRHLARRRRADARVKLCPLWALRNATGGDLQL